MEEVYTHHVHYVRTLFVYISRVYMMCTRIMCTRKCIHVHSRPTYIYMMCAHVMLQHKLIAHNYLVTFVFYGTHIKFRHEYACV